MGVHHGVGVDLDAEAGIERDQKCQEVGAIEGGADEEPARRPAVEDVVPPAGWVEARGTGHGGAGVGLERHTWHQTCGRRVDRGVASPAPHRSGRADFPHPALRIRGSLRSGRPTDPGPAWVAENAPGKLGSVPW